MKVPVSWIVMVSAMCFVIMPGASMATGCLDQAIATEATAGVALFPEMAIAQTFTCQLEGRLASIEIRVALVGVPSGPLVIGVYSTVDVSGSLVPLAALVERSIHLVDIGVPQDVAVDISDADLCVSPGQTLAVVMRTTDSPWAYVEWLGDSSSAYAGGKAYFREFGPDWSQVRDESGDDVDVGLRVSLVCATPVESHSWSSVKALFR